MKNYNIAMDGPAGAGKSTIARKVAKDLQFIYVDTGAMYRAMALYFLRNQVDEDDIVQISKACNTVKITIEYVNGEQQIMLNDENVTSFLRTEEVGMMTSAIAKHNDVRNKMVEIQHNLAVTSNVIMDGRDIGTVVLPNADLKVYLTASSEERAKRRFTELTDKGITCDINEIENDIIARDKQDMSREISPLKQAEDAVLIDSSNMSIDEVVEAIKTLFKERCITD